MRNSDSAVLRNTLAACVALAFGITGSGHAATLTVTDCSDGAGSGTLRHTIAAATTSGDIVNIPAALNCSTITLTQGQILLPTALSITGPGASALTIQAGNTTDAGYVDRVFISASNMTVSGMTISGSKYIGSAPIAGCLYSAGNITLTDTTVTGCIIAPATTTFESRGGAIFALGNVLLTNSTVSGNYAVGASNYGALGGGIYAGGGVSLTNSSVSGNTALGGKDGDGFGGGIYAKAGLIALKSTLSDNSAGPGQDADYSAGGGAFVVASDNVIFKYSTVTGNQAVRNSALAVKAGTGSYSVTIENSTFSENYASSIQTVGTYVATTVSNSTIAFNRAAESAVDSPVGIYSNQTITMQSSIFANNIAVTGGDNDIYSIVSLTGANNLIISTSNTGVPLGTLNSCPLLGPLANNGGPTQTLALLAGSPAINTGNNTEGFTDDQRSSGFGRVVGSAADIGAYELQSGIKPDRIFAAEFEGRCD